MILNINTILNFSHHYTRIKVGLLSIKLIKIYNN